MPLLSVFVVYVPTNTKNFFLASGLSAVWAGSSAATTADTKKRDANTRLVMFMGSSVAHVGLSECGSPAAALPLSATSEHGKAGSKAPALQLFRRKNGDYFFSFSFSSWRTAAAATESSASSRSRRTPWVER